MTGACIKRVLVLVPAVSQDFWGPLPSLPTSNMVLKGQSRPQDLTVLLARYGYHSSPHTTCLPGTSCRLSGQMLPLY